MKAAVVGGALGTLLAGPVGAQGLAGDRAPEQHTDLPRTAPPRPPSPRALDEAAEPERGRHATLPIVGGLALWSFNYLLGAAAAASDAALVAGPGVATDRQRPLYAPLIGPFVAQGLERPGGERALLAAQGVGQLVGLALTWWGMTALAERSGARIGADGIALRFRGL